MSKAKIYYHDIGDYLTREQKLEIVRKYRSIANMQWTELAPNEHGDWISQRNDAFSSFIPLEPEKKFDAKAQSFFTAESCGIATARDAWVYNYSKKILVDNIHKTIDFFNEQSAAFIETKQSNPEIKISDFILYDSTKISWTDVFIRDANKGIPYKFIGDVLSFGLYRPYCKQNLYFDKTIIHRTYQQTKFFPTREHKNLVICLEGTGGNKDFACIITDNIPDYGFSGVHTHCFPLYYYEENNTQQRNIFDSNENKYIRRDAVSDFILERAKKQYGKNVTKEDIFYYVYGFLHSPKYREVFASDLKKMLPACRLWNMCAIFWHSAVRGGRWQNCT